MRGQQAQRLVHGTVVLARGALLILSALLLTSIGGAAILAAPVTLPLLLVTATFSAERAWRFAATIVAALTAFEVAWAAAWVVWEHDAGSLAIGAAASLLVGIAFVSARAWAIPSGAT